jgi:hypothetical protein
MRDAGILLRDARDLLAGKNYNPEFEIGALKFKLEIFAEKVSDKLDDLAIEINNIKESKAYSIVVLESRIDELMKEKLDLCKTNAELRKENITMKHTIVDLNDKAKSAEEEKASLITNLSFYIKRRKEMKLRLMSVKWNKFIQMNHWGNNIQRVTK